MKHGGNFLLKCIGRQGHGSGGDKERRYQNYGKKISGECQRGWKIGGRSEKRSGLILKNSCRKKLPENVGKI